MDQDVVEQSYDINTSEIIDAFSSIFGTTNFYILLGLLIFSIVLQLFNATKPFWLSKREKKMEDYKFLVTIRNKDIQEMYNMMVEIKDEIYFDEPNLVLKCNDLLTKCNQASLYVNKKYVTLITEFRDYALLKEADKANSTLEKYKKLQVK